MIRPSYINQAANLEPMSGILFCKDGEVMYRNYTSLDCSGEYDYDGKFCDLDRYNLFPLYDCVETCDAEPCQAMLITYYENVTGCDGDKPSGYGGKYTRSEVLDYCGVVDNGEESHGIMYTLNDNETEVVIYESELYDLECSTEGSAGSGWTIGETCSNRGNGEYYAGSVQVVIGDDNIDGSETVSEDRGYIIKTLSVCIAVIVVLVSV